jgi:hypothetical protein
VLRTVIQVIAFLAFVCAAVLVIIEPLAWPALAGTGLLVLGTLWERFHYRGGTVQGEGGRWQATPERFLDEESGGLVTVWFNPVTGERRYVEQGAAPPV